MSAKLQAAGHVVSVPTVARLLRQLDYIAVQRAMFTAAGLPILRVDTKKKELVCNFKNAGQVWARQPIAVNLHDYPHDALGRAVP